MNYCYCKECENSEYYQAITEGTCKICGIRVVSPHTPTHVICPTCSFKYNLCEQCGKSMETKS